MGVFAVLDAQGRAQRHGVCPDGDEEKQGDIVLHSAPPEGSYDYVWDFDLMTWTHDPFTPPEGGALIIED